MNQTALINNVETVKQARKLLGITQMQLADKSGLSYSTISKFEAGYKTITPESLNKIFNVIQDEGFDLSTLIQLSQIVKSKGAMNQHDK